MKKIVFTFSILIFTISCTSLQKIDKKQFKDYTSKKQFNRSDFKTYVFNICEKYTKNINSIERFCECPDNFYDVAKNDSIKKVEELYLLVHRKTDMVLYLTTKSHKYISEDQTGFLNDRSRFEDNIALEEIESIYIGKLIDNLIHFPSYKDEKDIILHFDKNKEYPKEIYLTKANVATAENNYDIAEPISLNSVFKDKLIYKLNNYSIKYQKNGVINEVDRIFITSKKGVVNIFFGFKNSADYFKLKRKQLKYYPNFSLIREH